MDTSAPSLILIVDDETKIRRIVASNLERAGYDVISAADGMHALEILELQSPKPALVLMDVMMPEMDGFECACRIRELGETPIIFMTAKADSNSKLKGFNLARILNETFRKPRSIVQTIKPPKSAEEFGGFR